MTFSAPTPSFVRTGLFAKGLLEHPGGIFGAHRLGLDTRKENIYAPSVRLLASFAYRDAS
jgi:hypothetical protein